MRFAPTTFRPVFGRILGVVVELIAGLGIVGFIVAGDAEALLRYGWGLLLLIAVVDALFWRPSLHVAEHAITVRNVFSTITVPWPAIQRIDTKYALTLYTSAGKVAVWASPAPNRYAAHNAAASDARLASNGMGAVRPGDLLSTGSGAAAFVIRRHWDELRDDGLLDAGYEAGSVRRDIHWVTIVVLGVLAVATVLGIAL
ncbi:PH domain-containing protein [Salinibacterium sp. G-O1]|uniref:PH domain-containing protein n=1 Tax=Salinibacterium sp. G-O1 TaxID=3046208 RepID=UPI0024BB8F16|nr:PH domain-containing protein [Salinibacterium sp. G-O1]MDJ0334480.1 PH domain-containing protein [Salinibacterium sp. G-O1]